MVAGANCFPCFTCQPSKKHNNSKERGDILQENVTSKTTEMNEANQGDAGNLNAKHFTFRELATATKNFRQESLLSEGGFGRVYKGIIPATGQLVAVKQLDRHDLNSCKEFTAAVTELCVLHHENLANLVGYCADGDQRLLVYEYVPGMTLEEILIEQKSDEPPLDWSTRMKIAVCAARGLEYLHHVANPPILYRDLKASKILLDKDYNARLLEFGLAQLIGKDATNAAPPRVMGTYGYCAPEYVRTGQLTLKSDVYSFGVVLLELITGRRAIDTTRPNAEQNLVSWAQPIFRDPKKYPDMADPNLEKRFPEKDLNQAVAIAAMCLQEEADSRPLISDVVTALSFLSILPPETETTSCKKYASEGASGSESKSGSGSESESENKSHGSRKNHHVNLRVTSEKFQDCISKPRHKSSTKSKKGKSGYFSDDGSLSSSTKSSKTSRSGNLSKKISSKTSSKKSSTKDISQKSSRRSSSGDLISKSSRKHSGRISSRKSGSMASEDGSVKFDESRASLGNTSFSRSSSSILSEDEAYLFELKGSN